MDPPLVRRGALFGSPVSMAGLTESRAMVWVGPPSSCSGPRWGLIGFADEPTISPVAVKPVLPLPSPMSLWPRLVATPLTSGPPGEGLLAMRVFLAVSGSKTPPPRTAVLPLMVTFMRVIVDPEN